MSSITAELHTNTKSFDQYSSAYGNTALIVLENARQEDFVKMGVCFKY